MKSLLTNLTLTVALVVVLSAVVVVLTGVSPVSALVGGSVAAVALLSR